MSYRDVNRWSTKEDVLEDLAEVTGKFADVDEKYIVVGEEPPPYRRSEELDEEYNLRFADGNRPYEMQIENVAPDLKGITKLLRMMEEHDHTTLQKTVPRTPDSKKESVLTISKLDPNVPEFVPKGAIESSPSNKESIIPNSDNSQDDDQKGNDEKVVSENSKNDDSIRIDKKLDVSKLNADEIKDISLKLRNKISDVSNKTDLHTKKEKNVAIAALLKLYTSPQRPNPEEQAPIKLITPDYFATRPVATEKETKFEVINEIGNVNSKTSNETTNKITEDLGRLSEGSTKNVQTTSSVEDDTSTRSGKTSPKSYIESAIEINHFPHDPNVQKSIKKVTRWLQKPESPKPKGTLVCLGPISFKKKDAKSSVSDESSVKSSSPLNVATPKIGHFVPSKRAADLSKQYSQRGQAIERQTDDIWTRAMKDMKAIEKRKKLEPSTSPSDSRDDDGSPGSTS